MYIMYRNPYMKYNMELTKRGSEKTNNAKTLITDVHVHIYTCI